MAQFAASRFAICASIFLSICFIQKAAGQSQSSNNYYVKIVGIGAQTCNIFNQDIQSNGQMIRDYVAWAQGFMSGALMRAPEGKDVGLDLLPERLNLDAQVEFLKQYCRDHRDRAFSDAVIDLYRILQAPPS
ncbi:hypothetical protein [Phreatobacter oligotrophus]|uniref:hypothetical protein n=1 Tax=Phreatobacter oligotrophus TaxID=1122261 RepID=UPI001FE7AD04|nr:hypothetical protein [Phreatobacter oligotrophus]